jgi:hypothetical protein
MTLHSKTHPCRVRLTRCVCSAFGLGLAGPWRPPMARILPSRSLSLKRSRRQGARSRGLSRWPPARKAENCRRRAAVSGGLSPGSVHPSQLGTLYGEPQTSTQTGRGKWGLYG